MKNEMKGIFTVKRYNLWKCQITDIESIQDDDINHGYEPEIVE